MLEWSGKGIRKVFRDNIVPQAFCETRKYTSLNSTHNLQLRREDIVQIIVSCII